MSNSNNPEFAAERRHRSLSPSLPCGNPPAPAAKSIHAKWGRRHDAGLQRRAPYRYGRCGGWGRPEQRPSLVVAVAGRLEVVVDAPPTPPTEPSAGDERWIESIKLYRLWLIIVCFHASVRPHGS